MISGIAGTQQQSRPDSLCLFNHRQRGTSRLLALRGGFAYITKGIFAAAFLAALSVAGEANALELLTNGSFESGDLTGWSTSNLGTGGVCLSGLQDWNVSSSSNTGCLAVGGPVDGSSAAYVMNDGTAGSTYRIFQDILVPLNVASATLSWSDSSVSSYSGAERHFRVELLQGAVIISTVFDYVVPFSDGDSAWDARSFDIFPILASLGGQLITLQFTNLIPETWTGPAGLGLDGVSLNVQTRAIPEPASIGLFAAGLAGLGLLTRRRKVSPKET